jgi:hypothetical protein
MHARAKMYSRCIRSRLITDLDVDLDVLSYLLFYVALTVRPTDHQGRLRMRIYHNGLFHLPAIFSEAKKGYIQVIAGKSFSIFIKK